MLELTDEQIAVAYADVYGDLPDENTIGTLQEGHYQSMESLYRAILDLGDNK